MISIEVLAVLCMCILYTLVGRKLCYQFKMSKKLKVSTRSSVTQTENMNNTTPEEIYNGSTIQILNRENGNEPNDETTPETVNAAKRLGPKRQLSNTVSSSFTRRAGSTSGSTRDDSKNTTYSARRYSFMFMVISLVAILCYIPPWILILVESKNDNFWNNLTYSEAQVCSLIRRLYIVNHIVNPFIYGFFDSKFRHEVKKLVCRC